MMQSAWPVRWAYAETIRENGRVVSKRCQDAPSGFAAAILADMRNQAECLMPRMRMTRNPTRSSIHLSVWGVK